MSPPPPTTTRAIVAHEPTPDQTPNWRMEDVNIVPIRDDEVLVKIVASGICHTDVLLSSVPEGALDIHYPKVLGHEGSGYVLSKGSKVTSVEEGDPVLLSYASCGSCSLCSTGHPSFCDSFDGLNYGGEAGRLSLAKESANGKKEAWASFFGQSSFAAVTTVRERSIVNAKTLIKNEDELKLFAPLGCGLQTGAGALLQLGGANKESTVVVMGLGGVGLAAVMAGSITGCKKIIAVDRVASRLNLAKELGATDVIDTGKGADLVEEVKSILGGQGASICLDTTGVPFLIKNGVALLRSTGKFIAIGVPPMDFSLDIHMIPFISRGKQIIGCIEGDVVPQEFLPKMIDWYRQGKFPINKFIKFSEAANFKDMLAGMHNGEIIKPVLLW